MHRDQQDQLVPLVLQAQQARLEQPGLKAPQALVLVASPSLLMVVARSSPRARRVMWLCRSPW